MKREYEKNKKHLSVQDRAKERNKISALESRINKKLTEDNLKDELSSFKTKLSILTEILEEKLDSLTMHEIITELQLEEPQKRRRNKPKLGHVLNEYFKFSK